MRPEVTAFAADGELPSVYGDGDEIDRRVEQLDEITRPVTDEEARALADFFGPDDCRGVAWPLLHLIETGPNPVFTVRPGPDANEWQHTLWQRCVNAGLVTDEPSA